MEENKEFEDFIKELLKRSILFGHPEDPSSFKPFLAFDGEEDEDQRADEDGTE